MPWPERPIATSLLFSPLLSSSLPGPRCPRPHELCPQPGRLAQQQPQRLQGLPPDHRSTFNSKLRVLHTCLVEWRRTLQLFCCCTWGKLVTDLPSLSMRPFSALPAAQALFRRPLNKGWWVILQCPTFMFRRAVQGLIRSQVTALHTHLFANNHVALSKGATPLCRVQIGDVEKDGLGAPLQ